MTTKWMRLGIFGFCFAIWFLTADAYWMSKEREVAKCRLASAIELVKHTLPNGSFNELDESKANETMLINAWLAVANPCSWVMGAGNYWESSRGMAYWELLMLVPVINRFRFE